MRLCLDCGIATSLSGGRCAEHRRASNRSQHNEQYATREWRALSARILRAHRGQHGDWCPGDLPEHEAHRSSDLTVDHAHALSEGGALLDRSKLRVLCRSWNSTLGARVGNAQRQALRGRAVGLLYG